MKKIIKVAVFLLFLSLFFQTFSNAMTLEEFAYKFDELSKKQGANSEKELIKFILENKNEAKQVFKLLITSIKSESNEEKKKGAIVLARFIAKIFQENGDSSLTNELAESGLENKPQESTNKEGLKGLEILEEGMTLLQQGKYEEAKGRLEESFKIAKNEKYRVLEFLSLLGHGNYCEATNHYNDALKYYERALQLAETEKEKSVCYHNIGKVYDKQGKYEEALDTYNRALQIGLKVYGVEHPFVATDYNYIGGIYYDQGRYEEAFINYNKALKIQLKALGGGHPDVARSYISIGAVYLKQDRYEDALDSYNEALRIYLKVHGEEHPDVAVCYNSTGEIYDAQGKYEEALVNYNKALRIQLKSLGEAHPDVARCYSSIGAVYIRQGKYEKALDNYNKALKIKLKILGEEHPDVAENYNDIGEAYRAQGRYEEALINYNKALKMFVKAYGDVHPSVATTYNNMGNVYARNGKFKEALGNYNKALEIDIKVYGGEHTAVAGAYNNIGVVYIGQNKYEEALENNNMALKILKKALGEEHPAVATAILNQGLVNAMQGKYEEAIPNFNKALQIFMEVFGQEHPDVARSYNAIGGVNYENKDYSSARDNFVKSAEILEKIRNKIGSEGKTKAAFLSTWLYTYKFLISTLYYLQDFPSAFHYLELSKARSLLDEVSKNIIFQSNEIDNNLINELKGVKEKIIALDNAIASKRNQGQKTDTEEQEVFQLMQEYNQKLQEIYNKYPKYKKLTEAKIVNAEEVQKLLDDKTAIVEYSLGEGQADSFVFVITNNALQMIQLPKIIYKDTIDVFRETLKYPANKKEVYYKKGEDIITERGVKIISKEKEKEFQEINVKEAQKEANDKLYASLIKPLWDEIKDKDELIIVPDAELSFLPFEALKDNEGKYLIEKKSLSYIQSASLLEKVAGKGQAQGLRLLAFGGAIYNAGAGLAPPQKEDVFLTEKEKEYYKQKTEVLLAQRGALNSVYDDKGYEWVNLPGTEEEAKNIGSLFYEKEEDKNNNVLTGNKVTEERIKEMSKEGILKNYKILHFATHGLVELDVPELSAIILSQPDALKTGQPQGLPLQEDGYLTMGEIMTLNLNSELVNLSACETGLGKLVGGEGVTGLTQSFMMAGAKNVSVSLWSVADASTRDFMISFYQKVKDGKSYRTAMVETKREFIKSGKYAEPFYWAPFVLYGGVVSENEKTVANKMVEPVPDKEQTGKENIIKSKTTAPLSGIGPKTILIAKGNKDGIVEGMQFVIKHGDKVIVKLKVVKVNKDFSICDIVEGTSTKVTALDVAEFVEGK